MLKQEGRSPIHVLKMLGLQLSGLNEDIWRDVVFVEALMSDDILINFIGLAEKYPDHDALGLVVTRDELEINPKTHQVVYRGNGVIIGMGILKMKEENNENKTTSGELAGGKATTAVMLH